MTWLDENGIKWEEWQEEDMGFIKINDLDTLVALGWGELSEDLFTRLCVLAEKMKIITADSGWRRFFLVSEQGFRECLWDVSSRDFIPLVSDEALKEKAEAAGRKAEEALAAAELAKQEAAAVTAATVAAIAERDRVAALPRRHMHVHLTGTSENPFIDLGEDYSHYSNGMREGRGRLTTVKREIELGILEVDLYLPLHISQQFDKANGHNGKGIKINANERGNELFIAADTFIDFCEQMVSEIKGVVSSHNEAVAVEELEAQKDNDAWQVGLANLGIR